MYQMLFSLNLNKKLLSADCGRMSNTFCTYIKLTIN